MEMRIIPRASPVGDGPSPLGVQLGGYMAQPRTPLNLGDDSIRADGHGVHSIQLDDQMSIFAPESKGCIAVASALRVRLDAERGRTPQGALDVSYVARYHNGDRSV